MRRTLSIVLLAAIAVSAQAQLTLPYSGTDPTATLSSFQITKSGSAGRANTLYISNASNTSDVLLVNTVGLGRAAYFSINNAANAAQAIRGESNGTGVAVFGYMTGMGRAGSFLISNALNTNYALQAMTTGSGPALRAEAGTGLAGEFLGGVRITSAGTALQVFGGSTFTDTATFATAVATQFAGGGAGLTDLSANNIASGTLNDARLSSNVALLNASQAFTGANTFSTAPTFTAAGSPFSVSTTGLVTNLNADLLDGMDSTAFLQSVPVPLTLSGASAAHIIRGENTSTLASASGVVGLSSTSGNAAGVLGQSSGTGGRGVWGNATSATGVAYGVRGDSISTGGIGVYGGAFASTGVTHGVYGLNNSTSGIGVRGWASAATGFTFGGHFESNGTIGSGVYGYAGAFTGTTYGGRFQSRSTDGRGVDGEANASTGITYGVVGRSRSTSGVGVRGWASATSGVTYGVRGQSDSPSGYGVYFVNRFAGSGTKSFRIDHPFDPENKYLNHYCAEGPEPLNVYTGNVTTDASGEAWVQLPDYFGEISKDFKYQLTVVDDTDSDSFVIAKVARKIRENKFKIRTNAPRIEVAWEVKAVRNDLWVRKYGAPVEADKQGLERGKYQHPELYGKSEQMGMNYQPEPESLAPRSPNPKR